MPQTTLPVQLHGLVLCDSGPARAAPTVHVMSPMQVGDGPRGRHTGLLRALAPRKASTSSRLGMRRRTGNAACPRKLLTNGPRAGVATHPER
jgi:hypothetical protein